MIILMRTTQCVYIDIDIYSFSWRKVLSSSSFVLFEFFELFSNGDGIKPFSSLRADPESPRKNGLATFGEFFGVEVEVHRLSCIAFSLLLELQAPALVVLSSNEIGALSTKDSFHR